MKCARLPVKRAFRRGRVYDPCCPPGGSYDTAKGLLVTRYAADAYAVALSYDLGDGRCEEYAR